ncbi:MAG TPA: aspartyl protease family protein [Pyrinomonadaceae bacterium]|nr:aspartyl protease family protein [Pyrinomonadaceae bacterium]
MRTGFSNTLLFSRTSARLLSALLFVAFIPGVMFAEADVQQVNDNDFRAQLKRGEKLARRGDFVEAEKAFKRAIELDPAHSGAKLKLAFVLIKQRRLREAYDLTYPLAKAEPKNSDAFAMLGATLLSAGKFPEARTILYNSLRLNKKEALAWAGMGMLEFYENRIFESLANLQQAVFHDSNEPDYFFALAQVSARAERYKDAADAYTQFLALSRNTDDERRLRIKGLINFLRFLGAKQSLYVTVGEAETSVPIQIVGNRPVIEMRINGREKPMRFVLDTGSGISVISDETAKALRIEPITRGGFAKGIGGDGRFEIVYGFLRQVEIGQVDIRNVPVYIRKFHNDTDTVDGYIGLSLISKFLTTLDYGDLKFSLTKRESDETDPSGNSVSLPLRLTSSGFLSGEVQVEGIEEPLNFIVDTGASVSVISDDVANMKVASTFIRSEKMRVIGSAGVTDDVPSFLLPKVSFGNHSRTSITAIALDLDMINEASGFEQAGILGGNFLRNYRMTFDFKKSKVTFVPINGGR